MKKYFLYFFLSVAFIIAGYLLYNKWFSKSELSVWDLVPANSLLVYETSGVALIWNDLIQTRQWDNLKNISSFGEMDSEIQWLDKLTGNEGSIDQVTRNENLIISLHQISNSGLDAIFFIPLKTENAQRIFGRVLDTLSSNKQFELTKRTYLETEIRGIREIDSNYFFTYLVIDNILVGSFTPFLIEDVVRNLSSGKNFARTNENLQAIPSLSNDKGNLYINYIATLGYLKNFLNKDNSLLLILDNLLTNGFLDFTFDDQNLLFNGFSFQGNDSSFLATLSKAEPEESKVSSLIPSQTALLYQLNVGSGAEWKPMLASHWTRNKAAAGNWDDLQKSYGFQTDRFFSWIAGEIAFCVLESINIQKNEKILFINTTDINEAYNQINSLAERANRIINDTLYSETYSDFKITQLNVAQFPQKVLGAQFAGFDEVYYMPVNNYLIFSNRIESLKNLVVDIESENTWGKRMSHTNFLENTLGKFNASLIVDVPKVFNLLHSMGSAQLKSFLDENSRVVKSFDKISVQFRNQGDMLYTSLAFQNTGVSDLTPEVDYESVMTVGLPADIITKPYVVRNHLNGSLEVMVQDVSNSLYLINNQGEVLWKDSLEGTLQGNIEQIDYYRNNKLQYLVCLGDRFKLIDRTGAAIEDFELLLPYRVHTWTLIDYDRSKNYRILCSDFQGNLYLYDMNGENLEGWKPKVLSGRLGSQPFHLRIRGRDVIIAVQENGIINIMSRRGEDLEGFPLDLKGRTNNSLFVDAGGDLKSTIFTALANEGELIRFSLAGEVLDRNQLFKPNPTTTFRIVIERLGRTFVIMQQDGARLSMLDNKGVLLFEKDYLSSTNLLGQYYDFGSGKSLFIVIDPLQEFSYVYRENGELINSRPLESGKPVGILFFEGLQKFHVYFTFRNNFRISGFYAR